MSQLQPITPTSLTTSGGLPPARFSPLSRQLSRVQGQAVMRAAHVELEARLTNEKVIAVSHIVRTAQLEASMISAAENQLVLANPGASANVSYITQVGIIQLGETVADGSVKIRRI